MLDGKVALVTGGASGIGRATARLFARQGAKVAVLDINEKMGTETVESIQSESGEAIFLKTDVSEMSQIESAVQNTIDRFGRLDIILSNAAILIKGDAVETSESQWDRMLSICLKPTYALAHYAVPAMQKQGSGVMIVTGSVHAIRGYAHHLAYQASKGALLAMTRAMAADFAPTIRVNIILPGAVVTGLWDDIPEEARKEIAEMAPLKRNGRPEDVANAALFFASEMSSYITGTELIVDGGLCAIMQVPGN